VLSVVDKLERLQPDDLLKAATDALAGTSCEPTAVLAKVREFVALDSLEKLETAFAGTASEKICARLDDWRTLLERLSALGLADFVSPDLTIVRGLAYYTGFVFEVFERTGDGRALAGGGRYDALVKKLGGPDMPATGFGMGDVTLKNLLEARGLLPAPRPAVDYYAIVLAAECRNAALADVAALRRAGLRVDYSFKEGKFGKLIQAAEQAGAQKVLIYGPDEVKAGAVKIRDTRERTEITVPAAELLAHLENAK
jgi:histidyl-tRNA synthetase